MERSKVNIYTECSVKAPQKHDGCCYYIIEFVTKDGTPITRDGMIKEPEATEQQLTLEALTEAIKRLTRPCEIVVNTHSEYVFHNAGSYRYVMWQQAGWKNAKGSEVKNMDLWRKYAEAAGLHDHVISYTKEDHSYKNVMKAKVEKTAKILREEGIS